MERDGSQQNVTSPRDITCYGTMMGRFPRLTPVRLGLQVPVLTTTVSVVVADCFLVSVVDVLVVVKVDQYWVGPSVLVCPWFET